MYKQLLSKKFFQDHPYSEVSTQRYVYSILLYEGIEEAVKELLLEWDELSEERIQEIAREEEQIQSEQTPELIYQLLRKKTDAANRYELTKKALEFEDVLLPMVFERLIRSSHDIFIENAIRILARSQKNMSPELMEQYGKIRSPYVQSMVCLILGLRGEEDTVPWMMERFFEMKRLYPDENYDQGPLLALHELNSRFYQK